MVFGEYENLGSAGQTTKSRGMQDSVPVPFKTSPKRISFFLDSTITTGRRTGSTFSWWEFFAGISSLPIECGDRADDSVAVVMSGSQPILSIGCDVAVHG